MKIQLINTRLARRNSTTRLPFRYGQACLTWCPQALLQAELVVEGTVQMGYSGDCLPPSWFDKSPGKDFEQQIEEMVAVIEMAGSVFGQRFAQPTDFFSGWREAQAEVHRLATERQWPGLLASFGVSMVERAMIDAVARAKQISFATLIRENRLRIDATVIDANLKGLEPKDWLPAEPRKTVFVRHTVGLADPLTAADIAPDERLRDGQPQALEEYIQTTGIRYLKIKVCNDLPRDIQRLKDIAAIVQRHRQSDYHVTLDGNEQYRRAEDFDELVDAIKHDAALHHLWQNTLLVEQPLARDIALSVEHTDGIRRLSAEKPVIIDESDESLGSYCQAIELGYRGVSSKNCKGPIKSVLNAAVTWQRNTGQRNTGQRNTGQRNTGQQNQSTGATQESPAYLMSGEDLCCVGIVPVQSDLCLIATLGLEHVERNGHHYHFGLSYLPFDQQSAALGHHPDLYRRVDGTVCPDIQDGQFRIQSLQCVGFGFAVTPDFDAMLDP